MPEHHAILIAGMHRSGTSALARVINLLGADIGTELTPAAPGNPRGYWEEKAIVELNDECLVALGSAWDDPTPLPKDWLDAPWMASWRSRLAAHLRQRQGEPLIVVKDPRLCRLLPAWMPVLAELEISPHVVVAIRNPCEVAMSLARRDGMDPSRSHLLWLSYMLDAERDSRGFSRVFTTFSDLLTDWRRVAQRLHTQLGVDWPATPAENTEKIEAFLDRGLRHRLDPLSDPDGTGPARVLAAMVYAYARASCDDHIVQAHCWDDARSDLQGLLANSAPESTKHASASHTVMPSADRSLGIWEPADVASEMLQSRLYFRQAEQSAQEGNHVATVVSTQTQPMQANFTLPTDARVDFIRFDPAMRAGIFRLLAVVINGKQVATHNLKATAVHERRLPADDGAWLAFVSADDDPYVEIDIRSLEPAHGKPLHIAITFECDSLFDRLGRSMAVHQQAVIHNVDQAKQSLGQLASSTHRLEQNQHHTTATLAALTTDMAALKRAHRAETDNLLRAAGWGHHAPAVKRSPRGATSAQAKHMRSTPSEHLELLSQLSGIHTMRWRSSSVEAWVHIAPPDAAMLAAGWYLLSMDLGAVDGVMLGPEIAIHYAEGNERHKLPISTGIRQRLLLHCERPVRDLRLYPCAEAGAEFFLSLPKLRRLSRAQALLRLSVASARQLRSQGTSWATIVAHGVGILAKGKISATLISLYKRHAKG
ncbi:MAG: hypothetical protein L0H70_00035 [Xanthomonadales bacterium]|nr:hypothetical protein [Xanthomonadales bacterium]